MMGIMGSGDIVVLFIRGIMVCNGSWMEMMPDMMFATASVSNCGFSFVYRSQRTTANTRTVMRGRLGEVIRLSLSVAVSGIITAIF